MPRKKKVKEEEVVAEETKTVEAPKTIEELIEQLNAGAETQCFHMLKTALETFKAIDGMTTSKLKRVLKRLLVYPYTAESFQEIKLIQDKDMTKQELDLYRLCALNKDSYGQLYSFKQHANKLELANAKEKDNGQVD